MSKKVTINLVKSVIAGFYGNGLVRKTRLKNEGYNYNEVQSAVNNYLKYGNMNGKTEVNKVSEVKNERMKTNENGKNLIKSFESCRLNAYKDATGTLTIGWGHTGSVDNEPIYLGMKISQQKADELFDMDLERFENHVNGYHDKYNFTSNEFSALVSFAYNVGSITQLTAKGTRTKTQIADKMLEYVYSKGKKLKGLVNRRSKERSLFLSSEDSVDYPR